MTSHTGPHGEFGLGKVKAGAMIEAWFWAFVFTQCVECPIYCRAFSSHRKPWGRAFIPSAVTHPLFFLVIPHLLAPGSLIPLWMVEFCVVILEGIILRAMRVRAGFFWALIANGASLSLGSLSRLLWGWP